MEPLVRDIFINGAMPAGADILALCFGRKPPGWELYEKMADGSAWINKGKALTVIASVTVEGDGLRWLHLSIAHRKRLPTYDELRYLKRHWAGPGAKAVEVHAPDDKHVNLHPNCRHLWVCLDADPLPDFTRGLGSI